MIHMRILISNENKLAKNFTKIDSAVYGPAAKYSYAF